MNTHPLKVGHLVAGIVFLGFAATWALAEFGVIVNPDPGVVFPIILVTAGIVGLAASARSLFQRSPHGEEHPHDH
jgi:hypothetical protein